MWNFKIGRSLGLMMQTMPFIALRTAVYFGCSLLLILGWIGGPAVGALVVPESMWKVGAWGGFIVGAGVAGTVVYFIREYFLYLVKAGHIAVLVELMEGRALPKGKGQLAYAKDIVASRFVEASSFFVLDQVISGVLGAVNKALLALGSIIPGLDGAMAFIGTVLRTSLTFADEVILALSFRTRSTDIWRTSRDGVVLYAQNYKNILKNAFFLAILNYALAFTFFVVAWAPARWMASLMPGAASGLIAFGIALLLVYSLKKAIIEPLLMTALMQVYFKAIEGQVPNPAWTQKLEGMSAKFSEMKDKFVGPGQAQAMPMVPMRASAEVFASSAPSQNVAGAGQWQAPPMTPQMHLAASAYVAQAPAHVAPAPAPAYIQPVPPSIPSAYASAASFSSPNGLTPPQTVTPQRVAYAPQPAYSAPIASASDLPKGSTTLPLGMVNRNLS